MGKALCDLLQTVCVAASPHAQEGQVSPSTTAIGSCQGFLTGSRCGSAVIRVRVSGEAHVDLLLCEGLLEK